MLSLTREKPRFEQLSHFYISIHNYFTTMNMSLMSTIRKNVDALNEMILEGRIMDAFEKYYAEDVVMQDNDTPLRVGKAECRGFEEAFVNGITAFRGAEVRNVMVSEDASVSVVEMWMDYTHKEWGDKNVVQVAVQKWRDGQIVSEKFIYNDKTA
jgi:SnoaL-like domain